MVNLLFPQGQTENGDFEIGQFIDPITHLANYESCHSIQVSKIIPEEMFDGNMNYLLFSVTHCTLGMILC